MKVIYKLVVLWLASLCIGESYGQDISQTEFINQIKNTKTEIESIASQFEQTLSLSVLASEQKSTGNFYYLNPGKLKWEQLDPSVYTLVINGDESYKIEGDKKKELAAGGIQVVGFKRFILGTMDGSIFNSDHFESSFRKENATWQVAMIPLKKALSRRFEKINLTFDQEKILLQQIVFLEPGGDTRTIRFFNHQINTLVDDSNFQ
ncbi:Outer membrane lipoprotein-sorting protein [Reichenbachiella faecimaris]|uniref:Outer membrane lipoprotein-sorting protein n=1 Tax=Reichenbachiella faecimaris TaxID=692418 RepID=A0A1W2G681_REIFA|nr:outer membrane lipoprotein carrier protein LolA [Reichenbachiella faecimaris]SMD32175.1 Outer membrane lipoprotein-sorting protein [Reichenbachiella faecimaris]